MTFLYLDVLMVTVDNPHKPGIWFTLCSGRDYHNLLRLMFVHFLNGDYSSLLKLEVAEILMGYGFLTEILKKFYPKDRKPGSRIPTDEEIGKNGDALLGSMNWSSEVVILLHEIGLGARSLSDFSNTHYKLADLVKRFVRITKTERRVFVKGRISKNYKEIYEIAQPEIERRLKQEGFLK